MHDIRHRRPGQAKVGATHAQAQHCMQIFFLITILHANLIREAATPKRNLLSLARRSPLQTGKAPLGLLLPCMAASPRTHRIFYAFRRAA